MESKERTSDKPFARLLQIMDVVSQHPSGATMMEIVEQLGIPKSSVYRLVKNLVEEAYLQGGGRHGRYRLGRRFLRQYHNSVSNRNLTELVRPVLRHLSSEFAEVIYLNSLSGLQVRPVCAEFPQSETSRTLILPGDFFPVHATASGKVLCAYQELGIRQKMLGRDELPAFRPNTITDRDLLQQELEKVREQGYAIIDDELDENVFAISVPVFSGSAGVIHSVAVLGFKEDLLARHPIVESVQLLRQGAEEIAHLLSISKLS